MGSALNIFGSCHPTYLSCMVSCMLELAPYFACAKQVVKASPGHSPLPFWISAVKRTYTKIKGRCSIRQKIIA